MVLRGENQTVRQGLGVLMGGDSSALAGETRQGESLSILRPETRTLFGIAA